MEIEARRLDESRTLDYFITVLEQAGVIEQDVRELLQSGSIAALAPVNAEDERVYEFAHGGLVLKNGARVWVKPNLEQVCNIADSLAMNLSRFQEFGCLIHDPLKTIEEADPIDGEAVLIEDSLFYLNHHCLRSMGECERVVRRNVLSSHFLLFVGNFPSTAKCSIKSVVQASSCIVVGAYDGESYLIWDRR